MMSAIRIALTFFIERLIGFFYKKNELGCVIKVDTVIGEVSTGSNIIAKTMSAITNPVEIVNDYGDKITEGVRMFNSATIIDGYFAAMEFATKLNAVAC